MPGSHSECACCIPLKLPLTREAHLRGLSNSHCLTLSYSQRGSGLVHIEHQWLLSQVPCYKYQGLFLPGDPDPSLRVPSYLFTKDSSPLEFPSVLAVDLGSCVHLQGMAEDFYTLIQTEWGQVYGPEGHHNVQKYLVRLR